MILMWIVAGALAAVGVACIVAKLSQFGLLFVMLAAWLPVSTYIDLPGWVHVVFWITLLIGFAVAVIVAANPAFFAVLGMFLLIAVIVIWSFVASAPAMANENPNVEAGSAQAAGSSAADSAQVQGDQQPAPVGVGSPPIVDANNLDEWKVDLSTNPQHNYITNGIPGATAEEKAHNLLEAAKHNPYLLATQAYAANLWNDANNVAPLISADGLYVSAEGQALHAQLAALYQSGEVFIGLAPENALNTGYSSDGVTATQGITGDRTALVVQKDNVTLVTLVRCANTVLPSETKSIPPAKVTPPAQPVSPPAPGTTTPVVSTSPSTPGTTMTITTGTTATVTTPTTATVTTGTTSSTTSTSSTTTTPSTTTSTTTTPSTTTSTTTTQTTTTAVCPYNPSLPPDSPGCLQPKPSDPASWTYEPDKPPVGSPSGEPEASLPSEPDPIDPEVTPGEEVTDPEVSAPEATMPSEPRDIPDPVPTGAQPSDDPNTSVIGDPDGDSSVADAIVEEQNFDTDAAPGADAPTEAGETSPEGTAAAGALSGFALLGGLKLRPRRTTRRRWYVRQH